MKLEYLPHGPHGSGLIRLYEYVPVEVRELKGIAGKLATGAREQISLEGEKWITSLIMGTSLLAESIDLTNVRLAEWFRPGRRAIAK